MAARTNSAAVRKLLGDNYDTDTLPDLQPYIDTATVIVDRVVTCALARNVTLLATESELIERWLAAHYYTKMDPTYASKSTEGASGQFIRNEQEKEPYKDGAINLDYSGCLKAVLARQRVQFSWLGKNPTAQIDYRDRR